MRAASILLAIGLILVGSACQGNSRLANGLDCNSIMSTFFRLPAKQREEEFGHRRLDDQYDIYLCGNQALEPPAIGLASDFASEGSKAVPYLTLKLKSASDDLTIRDIVLVFERMSAEKTYDVACDDDLMRLIKDKTASIKDAEWRTIVQRSVSQIHPWTLPRRHN